MKEKEEKRPEGAQKGILHGLERSFSTPSTTPFFPNRNILCPILLLGCRKYVAKNTLACQVFSRYRRKMLPKYAEKHLVTNRAAIPFIYLGACATPSNTRTNTQRRDRRERGTAGHEQQRPTPELQRNTKQIKVLLRRLRGRSMLDQREEAAAGDGHQRPLHNVFHNVIHRDSVLGTLKAHLVIEPLV